MPETEVQRTIRERVAAEADVRAVISIMPRTKFAWGYTEAGCSRVPIYHTGSLVGLREKIQNDRAWRSHTHDTRERIRVRYHGRWHECVLLDYDGRRLRNHLMIQTLLAWPVSSVYGDLLVVLRTTYRPGFGETE